MAHLIKSTFVEIATLIDELELYNKVIFSTEDPDELAYYGIGPLKWHVIFKTKLLYEEDYIIAIGLLDGHNTVAKDIFILSGGNVNDEDCRIEGIQEFLEEYYEKYMEKNKDDNVYLIVE